MPKIPSLLPRILLSGVIAVSPLVCACSGKAGQASSNQKGKKMSFPDNEFWRKGGVGTIIGDVYVDLNAKKNRLLLADKQSWEGLDSGKAEVVIIYNGKVYSQFGLPSDFKMANSVLVSFQIDRIYFYDFAAMDGGYYSR